MVRSLSYRSGKQRGNARLAFYPCTVPMHRVRVQFPGRRWSKKRAPRPLFGKLRASGLGVNNGSRASTTGVAYGTWRSVKGDRLGSGLSPFYFIFLGEFPFPRAVARSPFNCARPTRAFLGRALREHRRETGPQARFISHPCSLGGAFAASRGWMTLARWSRLWQVPSSTV